jgi:nucleoside-diphosphate-sugar epimerase
MKILMIGGTRFFGIHTVKALLNKGHEVTIATRGITQDEFGGSISRLIIDRTDENSMKNVLSGKHFDVVIDKIAYCSNDIKYALDVVDCDKYIYMSSTSIYEPKHWDTREEDFDAVGNNFVWCSRSDFSYAETKRQAEYALFQHYRNKKFISIRYPFTIGPDDYTQRLNFYVKHVFDEQPMNIDNLDCQMSFIRSDEAGEFMAFLTDNDYSGAINGASNGTISLREIITYVEYRTAKKAIISADGDAAPYNGEPEYSINTDKSVELGYQFSNLKDWIYDLLDYYIAQK